MPLIRCTNAFYKGDYPVTFTTYYFTTWLGNGIADSRKRSLIIVYCLFLFVECYNIVPQHADFSPAENKYDLELSSKVFFSLLNYVQ